MGWILLTFTSFSSKSFLANTFKIIHLIPTSTTVHAWLWKTVIDVDGTVVTCKSSLTYTLNTLTLISAWHWIDTHVGFLAEVNIYLTVGALKTWSTITLVTVDSINTSASIVARVTAFTWQAFIQIVITFNTIITWWTLALKTIYLINACAMNTRWAGTLVYVDLTMRTWGEKKQLRLCSKKNRRESNAQNLSNPGCQTQDFYEKDIISYWSPKSKVTKVPGVIGQV